MSGRGRLTVIVVPLNHSVYFYVYFFGDDRGSYSPVCPNVPSVRAEMLYHLSSEFFFFFFFFGE